VSLTASDSGTVALCGISHTLGYWHKVELALQMETHHLGVQHTGREGEEASTEQAQPTVTRW